MNHNQVIVGHGDAGVQEPFCGLRAVEQACGAGKFDKFLRFSGY
jgi:hypothetical protein